MTDDTIQSLPLIWNLGLFALATVFVWVAGMRMVVYGDELAGRFGLTRELLGLVFLATATSLPEIVTTLSAALKNDAPLVLGNLFGGVTMQTAILAVADFLFVRQALSGWPRKPTHALEAGLIVVLLNVLLVVSFLGEVELLFNIGLGALVLTAVYPAAIRLLRNYDDKSPWLPVDLPTGEADAAGVLKVEDVRHLGTRSLGIRAILAALVVMVAGFATADRAGQIAVQSGLDSSFIGVALLSASTSMPEVSTTFAAVRMGAYTMAIANIFGSNLIMIALVLPADIFYRPGPILAEMDRIVQFSVVTGVLVTSIYLVGLLLRRTPRLGSGGVDSALVLAVYLGGLLGCFLLAQA